MHFLRKRDEFFKRPFGLGLGTHMAKVYVHSYDRIGEFKFIPQQPLCASTRNNPEIFKAHQGCQAT